jgi:hypothetical protein
MQREGLLQCTQVPATGLYNEPEKCSRNRLIYIVVYLLKARTVEREKQPLLGNALKQQ